MQTANNASPLEVLQVLLVELSREAAALLFDRLHLPPHSREVGRLASRRVRALRAVAATRLEMAQIEGDDPPPRVVRRIVELLVVDVLTAAREVLPSEAADRLTVAFHRRLEEQLDTLIAVGDTASPNGRTDPTGQRVSS